VRRCEDVRPARSILPVHEREGAAAPGVPAADARRSTGQEGVVTDATADLTLLDDLVLRADEAFRGVFERVFAGDPAANAQLDVEAVEPAVVDGVPTLVLITPWVMSGLFFPPGEGPGELVIASVPRRAVRGDVPPLGPYWSVSLVPDISRLTSTGQARRLATSFAEPFRDGVRRWSRG
jgi:hypothetical protein